MGFFGMNETQLKELKQKLEAKETELNKHAHDIKQREDKAAYERSALEKWREALDAAQKAQVNDIADIERRRQEIVRLEAEAKAGFAKTQREVFQEVIANRMEELDARQSELNALAARIANDLASAAAKEGSLAKRELAVTEREQRADAGFADKTQTLADEAKRQHDANVKEAACLRERENALAGAQGDLENAKEALRQREAAVVAAEQKCTAGWADERSELDKQFAAARAAAQKEIDDHKEERLGELEKEIAALREKRLAIITSAEENERTRIRNAADGEAQRIRADASAEQKRISAEIDAERQAWRKERECQQVELKKQNEANEAKKGELSAKEDSLNGKEQKLECAERHLKEQESALEDAIEERLAERRKSFEAREKDARTEIQSLFNSLTTQTALLDAFEQLKRQLGDKDPAEILLDLNVKTDQLRRLREDLASRPTAEMRERYTLLEIEAKNQKARADECEAQLEANKAAMTETNNLRRQNRELEAKNKTAEQTAELFEAKFNEARVELNRLRAAYERPQEIEARNKEIEMPHIAAEKIKPPVNDDSIDELVWLKGIGNACATYGLKFQDRILKAFHTALKTSEWSPLTVLAGVSGTGKSELPRLYSHFGGLIFEPLSVQPNWDSQESMLGFFNSIDNKFDAQPVLRLLAQSQKKWTDDYPGLETAVCMVLLDEMNLAHPELYFAEFLSKMETRRGLKGADAPKLPVKIGAGLPPYLLPLGRNVLWTGTMNQDETTKSLSDKVLDRSIVIHFPRPTKFARRSKLTTLDDKNRGPLLHRRVWETWWAKDSNFTEEQIKPFKEFVEGINAALAVCGRALGHRVWQSVEYYMANYPDVRATLNNNDNTALKCAMHIAFEDQLVQKVMPKLRGIDTRGKSKTECLDKISGMLNAGIGGDAFNLKDDFDLACELGYGQFIWQSANYLKEDGLVESESMTPDEKQADNSDAKRPKK